MPNTPEDQRKRKAERIAAGVCARCGKVPVQKYQNCFRCRTKLARYKQVYRERKAKDGML